MSTPLPKALLMKEEEDGDLSPYKLYTPSDDIHDAYFYIEEAYEEAALKGWEIDNQTGERSPADLKQQGLLGSIHFDAAKELFQKSSIVLISDAYTADSCIEIHKNFILLRPEGLLPLRFSREDNSLVYYGHDFLELKLAGSTHGPLRVRLFKRVTEFPKV